MIRFCDARPLRLYVSSATVEHHSCVLSQHTRWLKSEVRHDTGACATTVRGALVNRLCIHHPDFRFQISVSHGTLAGCSGGRTRRRSAGATLLTYVTVV